MQAQHEKVVAYVNSPIGTSAQAMSAARAPVEDVPIIDFVNYVQADAVKQGLTGADASLPVLSIAAPFNRQASFPPGQVSVRDVAGLYIYDNTLLGVKVSGQHVKDYLEYSVRYFQQVSGTGPFTMDQVTNARARRPRRNGTPDYNFDTIAGLDARADLRRRHRPAGRLADREPAYAARRSSWRMTSSRWRSTTTARAAVAGSPRCKTAPVVYNRQIDIRQLLIDWVTAHHTIDPSQFASVDWRLVVERDSRSRSPERRVRARSSITSRRTATARATSSAVWPVRASRSATAWPLSRRASSSRSGPSV